MQEFIQLETSGKSYERYRNDLYEVSLTRGSSEHLPIIWLAIRRIDGQPIHDWRDLQEIKNRLVGPQYEAVELYPAEDRVVDFSNSYHLWVIDDPQFRVPVGFSERIVSQQPQQGGSGGGGGDTSAPGAGFRRQRPFSSPPADGLSAPEARRQYVRSAQPPLSLQRPLLPGHTSPTRQRGRRGKRHRP